MGTRLPGVLAPRGFVVTTLTEAVSGLATRRRSRFLGAIPVVALVMDVLVILASTVVAVTGRNQWHLFERGANIDSEQLMPLAPIMVVGWLAMIAVYSGYRSDVFGAGTDEYKHVLNAGLVTAALVGVGCFLAKFPLSRGFFVLLFAIGIPAMIAGRMVVRRALHRARLNGNLLQRVLIAGSPAHVDEIANVLRRERWLGYQVTGALTPAWSTDAETPCGVPVVGNADDVALMRSADTVFFAGGSGTSGQAMRKIVWDLEQDEVQIVVAPSVTDTSSDRVKVRPVGGLPLMHLDPPTWTDASRIGKRAFDLLGSGLLLVAFSPVFLFSAIAVKRFDGGPVFFRQIRTGRHGEEFVCLKFRSMVTDAEALLARLHEETGHTDGLFKMTDDPRITGPGKWLRRFSIDELPQLWNVFRGDMSLVGPRPPLPSEVEQYGDDVSRRLHVRPGMTGLWQVSGRSDLSWEEAVRLDLYYVDNWSMLQDLSILTRTVGAVLGSRGAY